MRAFVLSVVTIAGCGFPHGSLSRGDAPSGEDADGPPIVDDAPDSMIDAPDAMPVGNTCSTTGLTCLNGSAVAVTCNGACWVKCTINGTTGTPLTAAQAAPLCTTWGGKLAPIRDANDQACVATTLFPSQASWIGFEQDLSATTLTGGWTWNGDGQTPTYTHWDAPSQPDDQNASENGQEQCAFMPTTGLWHDTDCTTATLYRFSCRKP